MKERGINNLTLANYMGVTDQTVSLWRTNKVQPSIPDLYRIAEYFKVDVRELLVPIVWSPGPSLADEHIDKKAKEKEKATKRKAKK